MLDYKVQEITNEYLAPKFFFLTERISQVLSRRGLVSFFTVAFRPILKITPDALGKDYLTVSGNPEEIRAIEAYPIVHVATDLDVPEMTEVDPLGKYAVYGIIPVNEKQMAFIKLSDDSSEPIYNMGDRFYITGGMIANYTSSERMLTDVGKFLCNYIFLADPFKGIIPYQNKLLKAESLDALVAQAILSGKAGRKEYNRYMNNGFWFGQDGTITTQSLSPKSLGTDPAIAKRKKELLEQYRDKLHEPAVLAKIEKELVDMDKAYIKGDDSEAFWAASGSKAYSEQRKKMYIMFGSMPDFAKKSNKINLIESSMTEGYKPQDMAILANEIRRGAYDRGKGTADGGTESKFITRVFQSVKITEEDCGTKRCLTVPITENNYKMYIGRFTADGKVYTEDELKALIGKEIKIRSPMYCECKDGYCYKCCGDIIEKLHLKNIGLQTLTIAEGMVTAAMKSMHVSTVDVASIPDITKFIKFKKH